MESSDETNQIDVPASAVTAEIKIAIPHADQCTLSCEDTSNVINPSDTGMPAAVSGLSPGMMGARAFPRVPPVSSYASDATNLPQAEIRAGVVLPNPQPLSDLAATARNR